MVEIATLGAVESLTAVYALQVFELFMLID